MRLGALLLAALLIATPTLSHAQQRAGSMSPIIASMGPLGVEIARLHSGSHILAAPVILGAFASGGGGFTGGTVASATTFTDDVTFNGGAGAITFGASTSEIVTADGVLNVSGHIDATGYVQATGGAYADAVESRSSATTITVTGTAADGATAIGVRIASKADLTTAGAKIASFGDNAGTSYAEKLAIMLDGTLLPASGALNVDGTIQKRSAASTNEVLLGANLVSFNNPNFSAGAAIVQYDGATLDLNPPATLPVRIETSGAKVACAAGNRGSLFYEAGGAGVADVWYRCHKAAADTYSWVAF